jgi:hypothetical protein
MLPAQAVYRQHPFRCKRMDRGAVPAILSALKQLLKFSGNDFIIEREAL